MPDIGWISRFGLETSSLLAHLVDQYQQHRDQGNLGSQGSFQVIVRQLSQSLRLDERVVRELLEGLHYQAIIRIDGMDMPRTVSTMDGPGWRTGTTRIKPRRRKTRTVVVEIAKATRTRWKNPRRNQGY